MRNEVSGAIMRCGPHARSAWASGDMRAPFLAIGLVTLMANSAHGSSLCFGPVKEKKGDVASEHRSFSQPFDYRVQVGNGAAVTPSSEGSTRFQFSSAEPLVKIWLGGKVVDSFRMKKQWLTDGRNCIYFEDLYETWIVAEKWQARLLCKC
jgi:hypothetical protein